MERIFSEFDPVFETLGLLYVGSHYEEVRQEMKSALVDFGIDEERFYGQHLKIYDKYVQTFQKNRVCGEMDGFFFEEKDPNYYLILLLSLIQNKDWFAEDAELNDEPVLHQLLSAVKTVFDEKDNATPQTTRDLIVFLDQWEMDAGAKWNLLRMTDHPATTVNHLISLVKRNFPAYQKASAAVEKPLNTLLKRYHSFVFEGEDKRFYELRQNLPGTSVIYPTLAFPLSQLLFEDRCYYGLLSGILNEGDQNGMHSRDMLLLKLKALADTSKLEILVSLKTSPKYNLEIARQLHLTAATTSHHMSNLLNCDLVGIKKADGRVYYHLNEEKIRELIDQLEQTLL